MNYNDILEEYLNSFKNFDNETIIEKYYFYVKDLFCSYAKVLNMEYRIEIETHIKIIEKNKKLYKCIYHKEFWIFRKFS